MGSFYAPQKHQKTAAFLMFLGGAVRLLTWKALINLKALLE